LPVFLSLLVDCGLGHCTSQKDLCCTRALKLLAKVMPCLFVYHFTLSSTIIRVESSDL
jgi:hypothetical protein